MAGTGDGGARVDRRVGAMLAVAAAIGLAVVALAFLATRAPETPQPSPGPLDAPLAIVYRQTVGDGVALLARAVDGRSAPVELMRVTGIAETIDITLSPDGRRALVVRLDDADGDGSSSRLSLHDLAGGTAPVDLGPVDGWLGASEGAWAADGSAWAGVADDGLEEERTLVTVAVAAGRLDTAPIARSGIPFGFLDPQRLVIGERVEDEDGRQTGWRWAVRDARSGATTVLPPGPVDLPPRFTVDPRSGHWIDEGIDEADGSQRLVVRDATGAVVREVALAGQLTDHAMHPDGRSVVACLDGDLTVLPPEGAPRTLLVDACSTWTLRWTEDAALAGLTTWEGDAVMHLVDVAGPRSVVVPVAGRGPDVTLLAILGRGPLPPVPFPADAAPATPVPTGGAPVADVPPLLLTSATEVDGAWRVGASWVAPADSGGVTELTAMPPVLLDGDEGVGVRPLLAPGRTDVVLEIARDDALEYWRWAPDTGRIRLEPPAVWPAFTDTVVRSPDGERLATAALVGDATRIVVWTLGTGEVLELPMPDAFQFVTGWPSPERLLVDYQVCTEGCGGRYPYRQLVDAATGAPIPVEPDGTSEGRPLHQPVYGRGLATVEFDAIAGAEEDDLVLTWPAAAPPIAPIVLELRDGDLLLATGPEAGPYELVRVPDVLDALLAGRAPAAPETLGELPAGTGGIEVAPDLRWALLTDQAGDTRVVELATGEAYEVPVEGSLAWAP